MPLQLGTALLERMFCFRWQLFVDIRLGSLVAILPVVGETGETGAETGAETACQACETGETGE